MASTLLLHGLALAGNLMFTHPAIGKDNVEVSDKVEMATSKEDKKYSQVKLSDSELLLSKFIYSQVKDFQKDDPEILKKTINDIGRTLATRYVVYKEGKNIREFLHNISNIDARKYEFEVVDEVTFEIATVAKTFLKDPRAFMWSDKTVTLYSSGGWTPKSTKKETYTLDHEVGEFKFWSLVKNGPAFRYDKMTDDEKFLAKVIYSETSTTCTPLEIQLVCKVIINRIGNKAFGSASNALEVVKKPGQFSCIDDKSNTNWNEFEPTLNFSSKRASIYAHYMLQKEFESLNIPKGYDDIVYYHDKNISCPKSWTNKYWRPVLVKETKHFKFYKVVENIK